MRYAHPSAQNLDRTRMTSGIRAELSEISVGSYIESRESDRALRRKIMPDVEDLRERGVNMMFDGRDWVSFSHIRYNKKEIEKKSLFAVDELDTETLNMFFNKYKKRPNLFIRNIINEVR